MPLKTSIAFWGSFLGRTFIREGIRWKIFIIRAPGGLTEGSQEDLCGRENFSACIFKMCLIDKIHSLKID